MFRDAITLPVRIGLAATRVGVRLTERAVILGLRTTERLVKGMLLPGAPAAPERGDALQAVELGVVVATSAAPRRNQRASGPRPNGHVASAGTAAPPAGTVAPPPPQPAEADAPPPPRPAEAAVPPPPSTSQEVDLPEARPAHISTEPALVEAFAEAGAEDGAGATVHIEEPWSGYAQMPADDVIARLRSATPEELAVVELYEGAHRRRKTVLGAAQRELRRSRPQVAAKRQS